jgi:hypothetical protein
MLGYKTTKSVHTLDQVAKDYLGRMAVRGGFYGESMKERYRQCAGKCRMNRFKC